MCRSFVFLYQIENTILFMPYTVAIYIWRRKWQSQLSLPTTARKLSVCLLKCVCLMTLKRWRYERVAKTGSSPPWAIVGMNFF